MHLRFLRLVNVLAICMLLGACPSGKKDADDSQNGKGTSVIQNVALREVFVKAADKKLFSLNNLDGETYVTLIVAANGTNLLVDFSAGVRPDQVYSQNGAYVIAGGSLQSASNAAFALKYQRKDSASEGSYHLTGSFALAGVSQTVDIDQIPPSGPTNRSVNQDELRRYTLLPDATLLVDE